MELRSVTPRLRQVAWSRFRGRIFSVFAIIASLGAGSCAQVNSDAPRSVQPTSQSKLVLTPNAVDFSNVVLGQKNSQTIKMSNQGVVSIQVKSIRVAGSAFSVTGLNFPFSLAPQASRTFNVEFAPQTSGPVSSSLTIESSLPAAETISVKGVGTKALAKLQTNPVSINFGNLVVKGNAVQTVVLSNTGNAKVTVNKVAVAGTGFGFSQLPSNFTLAPLQEASFLVSFHPQNKGSAKGSLQFFSKDLNSPLAVALAGTGVDSSNPAPSASDHIVSLSWDASLGNIKGYYVYRGEISGGPYTRLTTPSVPQLEYSDTSVASGREYFYVVTAVSHSGHESVYSQQISVTIPNP